MFYTGQRKSDAVQMGWGNVSENYIAVCQKKTKTMLKIPIMGELKEALTLCDPKDATFLKTEHGKTFTAAGFGNWMRERCDEAELKLCSSHG